MVFEWFWLISGVRKPRFGLTPWVSLVFDGLAAGTAKSGV